MKHIKINKGKIIRDNRRILKYNGEIIRLKNIKTTNNDFWLKELQLSNLYMLQDITDVLK